MKEKVNDLLTLHEVMHKKLKTASFSEKIQIYTLVQNILMSLNTLFELHMKSKKQVDYQQNLLLRKRKTITPERLHLITNVYEDDNFRKQMPEKKNYVSVSEGIDKQKLCMMKMPLQLAIILYWFQRKTPKFNYWVLKVLCLETQMVCSGWLKNDSLCVHLQPSSKCCVAS